MMNKLERFREILDAFYKVTKNNLAHDEAIIQLLFDCRAYCKFQGFDFDKLVNESVSAFKGYES